MTLDGRYLMVNASLCRMLGYTESELLSQTSEQITHATDRIREAPLLAALLRGERKFYEIEKRYIHRDGSSVWVSLTSSPVSGPSGELLFRVSVIQDITERRNAEQTLRRYELMAGHTRDIVLFIRYEDGRILEANEAAVRAYGYTREKLKSMTIQELRDPLTRQRAPGEMSLADEQGILFESVHLRADGSTFPVEVSSQGATVAGTRTLISIVRDITERKQVEEQLQKLNRILNARNSSNQALLHATDEPAYLHEVCRIVTEDCGYVMMWIGFAEHDENKTVRLVASAGFEEGYLEKLKVTWADSERGQGPSGTAIRSGKASMCRNVRTDPAFLPWRDEAIKRGYLSSLVIPFTTANRAVGAFSIYARDPEAFSDEEVSMLSDLAADLAFGIDTLRLRASHSQAEEQLHESEERYRNLFNSMDEGFCIVEMIFDSEGRAADYRFLKVNEAFEAQTGLHDAEGKLMRELAPAHEAHWFETYGRIALTGEPAHFLNEARALNRYYDVHAYRVGEAEQRQVAIVFNDISALKRAEEEREATIEFLGLVNQSQGTKDLIHRATTFFQERSGCEAVGIRLREGDDYPYFESRGFAKEFIRAENKLCVLGADGKPARDNLCNFTLECMCGSVISGRVDPSEPFFTTHGSFWTNSTSELLSSAPEAERQYRMRNRCNGEGYESVALFPLHDGEERFGLLQLNDSRKGRFSAELIVLWERLTAYLATALSKFRAEEALRNSERQYRAIGELINYGVWVCEPDGRNTYASESFLKLVGLTQRQCSDFGWGEVLHPDDAERTIAAWKECVRTGGNWEIEHRFRGVDGLWHPILARGVPVRDDQGQIVCWTGINLDIGNLKQSEQALLRSEKLASVGRMAAAIAHEINNPLGAVTNLLYLAKDAKDLPESSREYLEMADAELKRIAHIARQSLGFYRESSAPAPTSTNEVLESAVELLKSKIVAKHAVIQKRWETEVTITAVSGELRQVFSNLLANSLDAIDDGGTIQLRISSGVDHDNQRRCVRITIADNGKGIAAESRQHIFEPFFTTKGSIGTGLGLWVSKEIIDKHQGRIRLHSNTNGVRRGTAFTIVLPAEDATPMPSGPAN
jgi:PAS domain S-box-containing protein